MHLIVVAEATSIEHARFKEWLDSRVLSTGAHPVAREIKLYDLIVPESDEENFTKVLLQNENAGHIGVNKLDKVAKLIRMFGSIEDIKNKDKIKKEIKENPSKDAYYKGFPYIYIIGKMKDEYRKDGGEMI